VQHAKTGAVITDGGKFRVSVSVPHMGFIRDLNRVSTVVSSTQRRVNRFLLFLPIRKPYILIQQIHLSWNSFGDFAIARGNQTVVVFNQHFPTAAAHESIRRVLFVLCKHPHLQIASQLLKDAIDI